MEITVSYLEHNEFENNSIRKNFELSRVYSLKSFADEGLLRKPSYNAKAGFNKNKSSYKNINQVKDENVEKTGCFSCGKPGHFVRECLVNQKRKSTADNSGCFSCGKLGHFARKYQVKQIQSTSGECYNFGKVGHFSRDCPKNTGIKLVSKQAKPKSESSKEILHILKDYGIKCNEIICLIPTPRYGIKQELNF